ncbi:MAG: superoxide dismutase [Rikenellaceae bacterium]
MTKWRFKAKPLPYKYTALEPTISEQTLKFHHDRHYIGYINKLQDLICDTKFEECSLWEIVMESDDAIFNNAAQALNHEIYFEQFSPHPQDAPEGVLLKTIERDFGTLGAFKEAMDRAGAALFGSGWVWLVKDIGDRLTIINTSNAETPIRDGAEPLIVIDVWEHAYYLDYQNNRGEYLSAFWKVLDWRVVQKRWAEIPITENQEAL